MSYQSSRKSSLVSPTFLFTTVPAALLRLFRSARTCSLKGLIPIFPLNFRVAIKKVWRLGRPTTPRNMTVVTVVDLVLKLLSAGVVAVKQEVLDTRDAFCPTTKLPQSGGSAREPISRRWCFWELFGGRGATPFSGTRRGFQRKIIGVLPLHPKQKSEPGESSRNRAASVKVAENVEVIKGSYEGMMIDHVIPLHEEPVSPWPRGPQPGRPDDLGAGGQCLPHPDQRRPRSTGLDVGRPVGHATDWSSQPANRQKKMPGLVLLHCPEYLQNRTYPESVDDPVREK